MPHDTNRHTRYVALARLGLPIAALALLSMLFMVPERVDPSMASVYADVDVSELAREPRIGAPQYAGVTRDGSALMVHAKAATPNANGGTGTLAQDMVAKLETRDGLVADVTARTGRIDPASGQVDFGGGVAVQTSSGYRISTADLSVATDRSQIVAPGRVEADAPFGRIEAGAMALSRPQPEAPYDLVFKDGVRLVYQPKE